MEANAAGFKPIRETKKEPTAKEFADWFNACACTLHVLALAHMANSTGNCPPTVVYRNYDGTTTVRRL